MSHVLCAPTLASSYGVSLDDTCYERHDSCVMRDMTRVCHASYGVSLDDTTPCLLSFLEQVSSSHVSRLLSFL